MNKRFFSAAAAVTVALVIIVLWFNYRLNNLMGDDIRWDERKVSWEDFQIADDVFGDFDANISSEIKYPSRFSGSDNLVYATMYPDFSNRTADAHTSDQLLIHEQYHFNITEYHARLLRKRLLEKGASLSKSSITYYFNRINERLNEMQTDYDEESNHNTEDERQRYWELKIDDLLRTTAYYANPDLDSYYTFRKPETRFYRKIYSTVRQQILTSYPLLAKDTLKGVSYEILKTATGVIVKHRINGVLKVGGELNAAIAVIDYSPKKTTHHFLDKDSLPIASRPYTKLVIETPDEYTMISTYYDKDDNRTHGSSELYLQPTVYKKLWNYSKDKKLAKITFLDLNNQPTFIDNQLYSQTQFFDPEGRTTSVEQHDMSGKLSLDNDLAAVYDYSFDSNNNITRVRLYDDEKKLAVHLNGSNLFFEYDERGNIFRRNTLDAEGEPIADKNGVSTYEYYYDLRDNITSSKRFNIKNKPTLDSDNIFQLVTDYDNKDRLIFEASYNPEYVLRFNEKMNGASRIDYEADSLKRTYNVDGYNFIFAANDSIAITKEYLNEKGYVTKREFFGSNERPALMEDHAVYFDLTVDDRGNTLLETGRDTLGAIFTKSNNIASIAYVYDANNNKTKVTYLNAENLKTASTEGETQVLYSYNEDRLLIEKRNYDKDNNPVSVDGTYMVTYVYNRFKKDSIIQEFGVSNTLNSGPSTTRFFYNRFGSLIRETYHNPSGKRASFSTVSRIDYQVNEKQIITGISYYDANDRPRNTIEGYARVEKKRDRRNFVVEEAYFNNRDRPTSGPQGYHKVVYEWNETGVNTLSATYDIKGKLWENENGVAFYKYAYYSSAMDSVVSFFDRNNEPTEDLDGVAKITYLKTMNGLYYMDKEFDKAGNILNAPEEEEEEEEVDLSELSFDITDSIPPNPFSQELIKLEELIKENNYDENN